MTSRTPIRLRSIVATVLGSILLTGCDAGVYDLPLPGGADVGDDPVSATVVFRDVLDLVPQSAVKVDEVTVGKVTDIELGEEHLAEVRISFDREADVPANAVAEIRQTSLLGEKFVSLGPPREGASDAELADDAVIPVARTGRNPEVEEVLGALSLVLNGGGVAQLKTITTELNRALEGREDSARSVLTQLDTLMSSLDRSKEDIVTALESLDRLAKSVRRQEKHIDAALEELPSALRSIDGQRDDLVTMLGALDDLGTVGVRVIRQSKEGTIDVLRQLEPVLTELADSGDDLVNSLDTVFTYPFVDDVVGRDPQTARNLHMGDYVNLSLTLEVDLRKVLADAIEGDLLPDDLKPVRVVDNLVDCVLSGSPGSAACGDVIDTLGSIPNLPQECRDPDASDNLLCQVLTLVPGLPALPGAPGGGTSGGGSPGDSGEQSTPGIDLDGLGDLLGLPRAVPGSTPTRVSPDAVAAAREGRVATSAEGLQGLYDDDLLSLLTPGLTGDPGRSGGPSGAAAGLPATGGGTTR